MAYPRLRYRAYISLCFGVHIILDSNIHAMSPLQQIVSVTFDILTSRLHSSLNLTYELRSTQFYFLEAINYLSPSWKLNLSALLGHASIKWVVICYPLPQTITVSKHWAITVWPESLTESKWIFIISKWAYRITIVTISTHVGLHAQCLHRSGNALRKSVSKHTDRITDYF